MASPDFDLSTYYPIFAYLVVLILFVIGVMIATHTIGPNNKTAVKQMPYESGMDPIGDARQRFDVKFYLVAIMFLVFDVELLFLYPWAVIAYGENASDVGDHRPGAQAAGEFQVRAPLKEAGLTKSDIRALSARLGLPTADKPQLACLSSRIPTGEAVTPEKLRMIEDAEYFLRDLGFFDVRVRHHEIGHQPQVIAGHAKNPVQHLARIEVGAKEMSRLLAGEVSERVSDHCRRLGYTYVTLDLAGYRRGSTNGIASKTTRQPAWSAPV